MTSRDTGDALFRLTEIVCTGYSVFARLLGRAVAIMSATSASNWFNWRCLFWLEHLDSADVGDTLKLLWRYGLVGADISSTRPNKADSIRG